MPNLPISQLPTSDPLTGEELFAIVQNGVTKQTTFDEIYIGLTGSFVSSSTFNSYTSSVQSYYLSAYHTASLTTVAQNTPYSMSFSTTDFSSGITIGGPIRNQIQISNNGVYDIQFSAQVDKTSGTTVNGYIWLAKNGTNIPETNTQITLAGGQSDAQVAAWNFYVSASAGDYYELRYGADQTNFRIHYNASPTVGPDIPSVILTVGRIA
jgi:hypothetical protein